MNPQRRALFHLHILVFILGFTGILGKLITLDAVQLVYLRMIIATFGLLLWIGLMYFTGHLKIWRGRRLKVIGVLILNGVLIAAHWVSFFASIKMSNVSVALACFSSLAFFTALLEPLFFRRRIIMHEIILGIVVIIGLYLIFNFEVRYRDGILMALLSTFLAAIFTVLNGRLIQKHPALQITAVEIVSGTIALAAFIAWNTGASALIPYDVSTPDWTFLLILGILCTAYAFVANTAIMKHLRPFAVNLVFNLEPVYAILFAVLIFGDSEFMHRGFYIGVLLIIAALAVDNRLRARLEKSNA